MARPGLQTVSSLSTLVNALFASGGPTSTKQLPMHPADWHRKSVPWVPQDPATEWNQLVQAGKVTLAVADQAGVRDSEEKYLIEVG